MSRGPNKRLCWQDGGWLNRPTAIRKLYEGGCVELRSDQEATSEVDKAMIYDKARYRVWVGK